MNLEYPNQVTVQDGAQTRDWTQIHTDKHGSDELGMLLDVE